MLKERFGVTALPEQVQPAIDGRVLIMDGDSACYASAADAKKLETAVRRFHTNVLEKMFLVRATSVRVHLTPKGCLKNYRDWLLAAKPYQANRFNKEKPALLEVLRSTLPKHYTDHDYVTVYGHMDKEADDAIMIDSYCLPNAVVYSEDKDLCIVPIPKYDAKTGDVDRLINRYGFTKLDYSTSTTKVIGRGTKFFWAQMLMGDSADNVKGIEKYNAKLCGAVATHAILDAAATEDDAANIVFDGYRAIGQNLVPEAECLWLSRVVGDSARNYFQELNLSELNKQYLQECLSRKWFMDEDEKKHWNSIESECTSLKEIQMRWEAFKKDIKCK